MFDRECRINMVPIQALRRTSQLYVSDWRISQFGGDAIRLRRKLEWTFRRLQLRWTAIFSSGDTDWCRSQRHCIDSLVACLKYQPYQPYHLVTCVGGVVGEDSCDAYCCITINWFCVRGSGNIVRLQSWWQLQC